MPAYHSAMTDDSAKVDDLVAEASGWLCEVINALRSTIRHLLPDATEEPDSSARLIGYTYQPGTYKGLIAAIAIHSEHINLMFSKGVELLDHDPTGLLEGTGKKARHVKLTESSDVNRNDLQALIREAARRTPRS